jgi:hypothetical protein
MQLKAHRKNLRKHVLIAAIALFPALPASAEDLPDWCSALKTIVATQSFVTLAKSAPLLPAGSPDQGTCRSSAHVYDCRWKAHWAADGVVADPLEELGADIAACFPDVRHDVNTATRQHFSVRDAASRHAIGMTATTDGPDALRLRIVR